jgi:hypothetical protein
VVDVGDDSDVAKFHERALLGDKRSNRARRGRCLLEWDDGNTTASHT